jgi:phosphatidate cytidylyltransferase
MLFLAPARAWLAFAAAIALLAFWEWSRLCGFSPAARRLYLALCALGTGAFALASLQAPAAVFANLAQASFIASAYFWCFGVTAWLALGLHPEPWARGAAGWLVLWPFLAALVTLRAASPWVLLAAAALVWVADIAAYFAGRAFGRRKLAPSVSPGKTWAGVYGALAGVLAYGALLDIHAHWQPGPLSRLFDNPWGLATLAAMAGLTAFSVLGDLFESWMKRCAGVKDSSRLLPGHGGVLDRIDALTSTLPIAALLVAFAGSA